MWIPKSGSNPELAKDYLKFVTSASAQKIFSDTLRGASMPYGYKPEEQSDFLKSVAESSFQNNYLAMSLTTRYQFETYSNVSSRAGISYEPPMLVTLSGIVTLLIELQPANALAPMFVVPFGIRSSVTSSSFRYNFPSLAKGLLLPYPKSILHQALTSVMYTFVSEPQAGNTNTTFYKQMDLHKSEK